MSFSSLFKKKGGKTKADDESNTDSNDSSFYGSDAGSDESKDASQSYYGVDESEREEKKPQKKNKQNKSSHSKQKEVFFGLTWLEVVVIFIELVLLTYTVLVFLGYAKLF